MYHSCTSKTTSIIKTIKGARPLPTLRLEEGDCAPIFVQFTKIIQDLFYLDEFILDSLIIHLENCTIYHDESAIAFCIQYQNNASHRQ